MINHETHLAITRHLLGRSLKTTLYSPKVVAPFTVALCSVEIP